MEKKALVIGIAGGSASGKSTICGYIEKELDGLNVEVLHIDSYYKENMPKIIAPITGKEYEDFNHPDGIYFDRLMNDYRKLCKKDLDVIIIEGLMTLQREEIREVLDLKLFVDCQADERIVRRLKRNLAWGESFDEITNVYLDAVRYRHNEFVEPSRWHADIVLNGSNFSDTSLNMVVDWIKSRI